MARKSRNHPVPRNACGSNLPERDIEKQEEAECRSFSAALYIRLSKEDSGKQNPDTIENQTALLEEYVKGQPDITVYRHYVDNGFSGTGFRRPAFENMMEDAKAGKVNCIIVKDLSRFGRNYLETGNYLEKVFPFLKLRFISVTDHLDTLMAESGKLRQPDGLEVPLKNIINEIYAKDISKKTSAAIDLRKHEGRYGGGVAPYGYRKSETEKGRYEVDREAAGTVRKIFEYRAQGYGYCTIAKILNEQGIMSPGAHRFAQHVVRDERMQGAVWKMDVIRSMLHDEVYLGSMVRGKTHMALHKGERRHHVPREDWIVVPETHEAIISRELYDKVQAVNAERAAAHRENMQTAKKQSVGENIFRGKLFCGDCGAAMALHGGGRGYREYYCPTYRRIGEAGCRKKHMGEMKLK
nr:recombinase family protein [uncultured Blautia sp.]